jgi:hypothetical protein
MSIRATAMRIWSRTRTAAAITALTIVLFARLVARRTPVVAASIARWTQVVAVTVARRTRVAAASVARWTQVVAVTVARRTRVAAAWASRSSQEARAALAPHARAAKAFAARAARASVRVSREVRKGAQQLGHDIGVVARAGLRYLRGAGEEFAGLIRELTRGTWVEGIPWHRIRTVATVAAVAGLAALWSGYHISTSGLKQRQIEFATAEAQIMVDTPVSILLDADQDQQRPGNLALTYALYLKTDAANDEIAAAAGVRGEDIATSGPFTELIDRTNVAQKTVPTADPKPQDKEYRLVVDVAYARPMLTLYGQAPTTREATALVNGARKLLFDRVHEQQATGLQGQNAVLRSLGPTEGGRVNPGSHLQVMLLTFFFVFVTGLALVRWRDRRRKFRRLADAGWEADPVDRIGDELPGSDDWPRTTRVMPWALAGFVAMLFLVPFDAISLPVHLPLDSKLDRPYLIALVMLWFSSLAVVTGAARPRVKITRVHIAAMAFLAICLLSIVVNGAALTNLDELQLTIKKIALLVSYLIFFVIVASGVRPREVPRFAAFMVGLSLITALGAILEYRLRINPFYSWTAHVLPVEFPGDMFSRDSLGRLTVYGPTSQPLELATILGMMVPWAFVGALESKGRKRLLYALAIGLLLAGAMSTVRKTSVMAPAAGILVLIAYRPRAVIRRLVPLGLMLGFIIHFTSPGAIGSIFDQLNPTNFNSALTTKDRTSDYDAITPDVSSHLLLGRGFQSYDGKKYRILDNEYLVLVLGVGFIGLAAYISIFVATLSAAHPTIRGPDPVRARYALAAAGSVGVMGAATLLFDNLSFPHVPYLFFFIAGLILALREKSPVPDPLPAAVPIPSPWKRRKPAPMRRPLVPAPARTQAPTS